MRAGRVAAFSPSQRLRALYREHYASPPFLPIMPHDRLGPPFRSRERNPFHSACRITTFTIPPRSFSYPPPPPTDPSLPFEHTRSPICKPSKAVLLGSISDCALEIEITDWRLEFDQSNNLSLSLLCSDGSNCNLQSSISSAQSDIGLST